MTRPSELGRWLETLAERSTSGFVLLSHNGDVEWANSATRATFALDHGAIEGTSIRRWIPDLEFEAGRSGSELETTGVSAGGDHFPIDVSIVPIDDGERSWVVLRDTSRRRGLEGSIRKHAEELEGLVRTRAQELEEVRTRYRRLYDTAPVLDFDLDSQGSIASANRKACLSLGASIDRLIGLPLSDLALPDCRADLAEQLEKMRAGSSVPVETRLRGAEGTPIDVLFHACRQSTGTGVTLRVVGLDVTARREAERLVDQGLDLADAQRARMERIVRGIGEGLVVTDPDGQVRLMNGIAEELLGVQEHYAFGRDLLSEQSNAEFVNQWRTFVAGEADRLTAELSGREGPARVFAVTMSRIRTPEDRPAGCTVVLRDVTRDQQTEQRRQEFLTNVTHELRTPLASIRGLVVAMRDAGPRADPGMLDIVEQEAERLQRLIENLLIVSSPDSGHEALNFQAADFNEVISKAYKTFAPLAAEKDIRLELGGERRNGSGIFDPERMRRVLDNLIGNALKFTPPGGSIRIESRRNGDRLECTVADTGVGMSADVLENIFERFYSRTPAVGNPWGTGLGLTIVRRLVELHGGEIAAESRLGTGSTLRFFIPAAPRTASGTEAETDRDDPLIDDPDAVPSRSFPTVSRAGSTLGRESFLD